MGQMTLIELLWAAKQVRQGGRQPLVWELARGILDLLGEIQPCGFEPPFLEDGYVTILDGSEDPQPAYQFSAMEARWFAVELLKLADKLDDA